MTRLISVLPLICAATLAACAAPAERVAFESRQEQVCYQRVSADLPANQSLRRAPGSGFVKVTEVNGMLRDAVRAPEFDECMAQVAGNPSFSDMRTVTFTAEEQLIWSSLTDEARRDALAFINAGGTLREFVAR